jgi:hypothetical protein
MKKLMRLMLITIVLIGTILGQSINDGKNNHKRDVDICFSYDEIGNLFEIVVKPNQVDKTTHILQPISPDHFSEIMNDIVPETDRGKKIKELNMGFGRASGKMFVYENVKISVTIVCPTDICGISYARIQPRKE